MNTAEIINYTYANDIHLSTNGKKLVVDAPKGALTPDIKLALVKNKPELIIQIEHVETAIEPSGLTFSEVYRLMDNDDRAEYCAGELSIEELQEFSMSITNRRLRKQGIIPSHYTAKTDCPGCGTVPIFENAPPSVLSCLWCFNRVSGRPMPWYVA